MDNYPDNYPEYDPERDPAQGGRQESGEPLRDWQRNTWYGPAPENPFDEPEDAPELRELRSEELNNRSGEFWETRTGGYRFGEQNVAGGKPQEKAPPKEKSRGKKAAAAAGILAALLAVAAVLYYGVFAVRDVQVTGNSVIPAGEIIRLSGIRTGTPIFSLNSGTVERAVEQNPYLKFRYLEKKLPGTVVLGVREREACCWMTWNGILYTMDKQRTVLFESEDITIRPSALVRVDGLKIRSGTVVGQTLALESAEQQDVFSELFLEMKVLGCTELIEEADLSNLSSLLLTTRDGFTVAMGSSANIHAKLRSMLLTRDELIRRGYQGGVINVTLPETPIFSPADT